MKKDQALNIIKKRKLISEVGKFSLVVSSVSPFTRGELLTHIVNFAAMTPFQVSESKKRFIEGLECEKAEAFEQAEEKFQEATNLSFSASILDGKFVPQKGEVVDVEVGTMVNKEGITIFVANTVIQRKAKEASNINFSFEETPVVEENAAAEESEENITNIAAEEKALV